jgi:hypothetical protein
MDVGVGEDQFKGIVVLKFDRLVGISFRKKSLLVNFSAGFGEERSNEEEG